MSAGTSRTVNIEQDGGSHNKPAILLNIDRQSSALLSCLVCILANTPGGVKRSGLGAHAVGLLVVRNVVV